MYLRFSRELKQKRLRGKGAQKPTAHAQAAHTPKQCVSPVHLTNHIPDKVCEVAQVLGIDVPHVLFESLPADLRLPQQKGLVAQCHVGPGRGGHQVERIPLWREHRRERERERGYHEAA